MSDKFPILRRTRSKMRNTKFIQEVDHAGCAVLYADIHHALSADFEKFAYPYGIQGSLLVPGSGVHSHRIYLPNWQGTVTAHFLVNSLTDEQMRISPLMRDHHTPSYAPLVCILSLKLPIVGSVSIGSQNSALTSVATLVSDFEKVNGFSPGDIIKSHIMAWGHRYWHEPF